VLEGEKNSEKIDSLLNGEDGKNARRVTSLICAYLFYSYLLCLRAERLAISLNVNGDGDEEYRKLILARKYALLKNRAMPDSFVLPVSAEFIGLRGRSKFYSDDTVLRLGS